MSESKPKFYMPESQTIPTELIVKENGLTAYYGRLEGVFAYEFRVYAEEMREATKDEECTFVKRLADILCSQSYDHGQSWRIVSIEYEEGGKYDLPRWVVRFRIRDAW